MTTRYRISGLVILSVLLFSLSIFADDAPFVGRFLAIEGDVRIKKATSPEGTEPQWTEAGYDMPVHPDDLIKTGTDGRATVIMEDRAYVINPGLLFRIPVASPVSDIDQLWKQLTDDLGVMLSTDKLGVTRGRLYVRIDGKWMAVALESPEEFLPNVIPLSH